MAGPFGEVGTQLLHPADLPGPHPVALGDPGEVQAGDVEPRRVRHAEQLAEPAQRPVRPVPQQHDGERHPVLRGRPQGGDAVVGRAVPDDTHDRAVRLRHRDADRAGQPEAEPAGRREVVGAGPAQIHLAPPGGGGRRRLHDVRGVAGQLVAERGEDLLRVEQPVPGGARLGHRPERLLRGAGGVQRPDQQFDHGTGVGDQRLAHRGAGGGGRVLGHLEQPGALGQIPAGQNSW